MFQIDRKDGTVQWQKYTLSADLTYEAFCKQFPELRVNREWTTTSEKLYREIELPTVKIVEHEWRLIIHFLNHHINSIRLDSVEVDKQEYDNGGETAWLKTCLEWLQIAKKLFTDQLGKPDSSEWKSYFLYDEEDYLSASELAELKISWRYTFPWGQIWLGYETQEPGGEAAYVQYSSS